jgi:predicted acylesterase/phospholipase RssA
MASSAIPLLFPTVQLDGHLFVDGGVMVNMPAREARCLLPGQDLLLAGFDVSWRGVQSTDKLSSVDRGRMSMTEAPTLRKAVKAMGGDLRLVAAFPDGEPVVLSGIADAETKAVPPA